jgi:hypothetical protein
MTRSLSQAGLDRLHQAMAARVAKGELPGMVILVVHGDDVHVDAIGVMAFGVVIRCGAARSSHRVDDETDPRRSDDDAGGR